MAEKWVSPNRKKDGLRVDVPLPSHQKHPADSVPHTEIKQHDGPYLCIMRSISPMDEPGERLAGWLNENNKDGFDLLESFSLNAVDRMFIFRRR